MKQPSLLDLEDVQAIYLAGPMSKYKDDMPRLYAKCVEASRIEGLLVSMGYNVFNPYSSCLHPDNWDVSHDQWIETDTFWMQHCQALILLPGWEDSRGALAEIGLARKFDLWIYELCPGDVLRPWTQADA